MRFKTVLPCLVNLRKRIPALTLSDNATNIDSVLDFVSSGVNVDRFFPYRISTHFHCWLSQVCNVEVVWAFQDHQHNIRWLSKSEMTRLFDTLDERFGQVQNLCDVSLKSFCFMFSRHFGFARFEQCGYYWSGSGFFHPASQKNIVYSMVHQDFLMSFRGEIKHHSDVVDDFSIL